MAAPRRLSFFRGQVLVAKEEEKLFGYYYELPQSVWFKTRVLPLTTDVLVLVKSKAYGTRLFGYFRVDKGWDALNGDTLIKNTTHGDWQWMKRAFKEAKAFEDVLPGLQSLQQELDSDLEF